ncbi:YT521-B-like splicing factor [Fusarium oxysporum f. sp. phaseoli]
MGDIASAQVPDVGALDQDTAKTVSTTTSDDPMALQDEPRTVQGHEFPSHTQEHPTVSQHAFSTQFDMSQPSSGPRPGPYNMASMANALPTMGFRPGQYHQNTHQRMNPAGSPPMMQHMSQFPGHPPLPVPGQGYYLQPQVAPYYGNQMHQAQAANMMSQRHSMAYYPNQMMMGSQQSPYYYPPGPQYQPAAHPVPNGVVSGHHAAGGPTTSDPRAMAQTADFGGIHPQGLKQGQGRTGKQSPNKTELKQTSDGTERRKSAVRGPPRKPRQSGHAIWIGNLPPQTDLMSLVHHVCKEAIGLESLFLISKSNCAFANFKDEETCSAAQQKLHDSKFQSVRLVSRLRKSTVEGAAGVTAPTGPSVATTVVKTDQVADKSPSQMVIPGPASEPSGTIKLGVAGEKIPQKDKFFILKSLTVEDLELSVSTGIWATQSHNEEALNNAFKDADNVYLVFSANKSGEYYGYARMISQINEDPAAAIEFAPTAQATNDLDLPKAIPTEANEQAPKGRIIDDSARGTIFWEADRDDADDLSDAESEASSTKSNAGDEGAAKTWGKPFKLEWLSTSRLPFYRTRGLRNPWNSNREVKIARDGTELEPSVGRRLIGLFNRAQNPEAVDAGVRASMVMMQGFGSMRPYGQ